MLFKTYQCLFHPRPASLKSHLLTVHQRWLLAHLLPGVSSLPRLLGQLWITLCGIMALAMGHPHQGWSSVLVLFNRLLSWTCYYVSEACVLGAWQRTRLPNALQDVTCPSFRKPRAPRRIPSCHCFVFTSSCGRSSQAGSPSAVLSGGSAEFLIV